MAMNAHRSAWAMFGPRLWLVLAWMACIFLLSAQQGTESAGLSEAIARFLATCVSSIAQALGMDPAMFCVPVLTALFHPLVRKAAHATEYAVLAMLLVRWLAACLPGKRRVFMVAFGIACLYAVLDEAHQLLVPGRAGQAADVAVDALGAAFGLFLYRVLRRIRTSGVSY